MSDAHILVTGARRAGDTAILAVDHPAMPSGHALAHLKGGGHTIEVPMAALADRMAGYGLASAAEACEAILREHAQRIFGLAPLGIAGADLHGGLRQDVRIAWAPGARAAALAALGGEGA